MPDGYVLDVGGELVLAPKQVTVDFTHCFIELFTDLFCSSRKLSWDLLTPLEGG